MTIWEISEKADYIADRHRQQQEQWHIYCNSLVQGITLSKARLHHAMSCAPDKELCFVLFGHFQVFVALAEGFNSHTIEYYVENKNGGDKYLIPRNGWHGGRPHQQPLPRPGAGALSGDYRHRL